MRHLKHKYITEDSLLEPRPSHWLEWVWKHSRSQDQWWELLGSLVQQVYDHCSEPRVCQSLLPGCQPLSDLVSGTLSMNGFSRLFSWPLGYIIIRVQVKGLWGYNKDQVALVIPHPTNFWLSELVKNIPLVGLSLSRSLHWEWDNWKLHQEPNPLEQGCQDD